jgi:heptosyltransferase-2
MVKKATFAYSRQHQKYSYIDLMAALGAPDSDAFPELRRMDIDSKTTSPSADGRPQLSLCPGAEYGPAKRWPASYFSKIANEFIKLHNARVVILGAAKDRDCAAAVAADCLKAENKTGQTSLEEFMTELTRSRLVLCNDSGSMHLASALGVPTVALFGSTEPRRTGPLGPRTVVMREHVSCSPCFLRECPLDFSCMRSLTVEKVLAVCSQQWA